MPARVRFFGSGGGGSGPTPPPFPYTPPLDAYPATAAYSVRKLSSTYSGSCIEAYRVSDGATQDIGFDGDGLLNTADIISFASGGEVRVRTWYDQTSNGYDAVGVSTGEYPVIYDGSNLITDGDNPALKFINTNNSGLQITPNIVLSGNLLIVALANTDRNSGANHKTIFYANTDYSTVGAGITDIGGTGNQITQGWSSPPNNVGSTATEAARALLGFPHIRAFSVVSSVPVMECDGLTSAIKSSWTPFTETFIGRRSDGAFDYLGVMQEIMVWNTAQASIIPTLESNLNSYYQVANLPDYTSGFLADYPDAVLAFSVRKLSNTAIKCMRVRRAVAPFDEKDIGFTAGGDLDEAAIVAFGGSDELRVAAWYDQSGQSIHATNITPTAQPEIYNGTAVFVENGKPTIQFVAPNGTNRSLSLRPLDYSAALTEGEMFTAVKWLGSALSRGGWKISTQSQDMHFPYYGGSVYDNFGSTSRYSFSPSVTLNNFNLYNAVTTPTEFTARLNGNVETTSASNTVSFDDGTLGGTIGMDHHFSEWILFASSKSTVERTAIENNINDYFEIVVNDEAATSGFLFDYPNAAVAYSVRQLNNNAEFAMQVMRADGGTKNIGFDGNGDLDTQAIIDFSGGNAVRVNRFYDQTGAQNHSVSIATPTNNTLIYDGTSIITENGMPMARYSLTSTGTSRIIAIANNPLPQGLTHSVYAVGQRPSAPNAINIFTGDGTPTITALYQERSGNLTYGPGWTSYGIYTYPAISNAQRLYAYIRKNGTDGECFNDGVSRGTTSAMVATDQVRLTGWDMRKSGTAVEEDCSGLQELIYYNDDRTSVGDNSNILSNIKSYFSIP